MRDQQLMDEDLEEIIKDIEVDHMQQESLDLIDGILYKKVKNKEGEILPDTIKSDIVEFAAR